MAVILHDAGLGLDLPGPTVVGPLLRFVRPTEHLQQILIWEGSLIDPVGGIPGTLVFHAVVSSTHKRLAGRVLGELLASATGSSLRTPAGRSFSVTA